MNNEVVLGVDGGKSKTVALLATHTGMVIGKGRAGSSDKYDVPLQQAVKAISVAVEEAGREAGVTWPVKIGCFGLAGADWPEDIVDLERELRARGFAEQVVVKNDMSIALQANANWGVVVSAGTHTAAAIRLPDGSEWHSGWFAFEGPGGVTAGHRVLWAVLKAYDGRGEPTALTELVLEATGHTDELALLRALSQGKFDDANQAALAPLLFEAHYQHGDRVAAEIIVDLGVEIASWATGLLSRFDLQTMDAPVILTGGMFKGEGSLLLDTVTMSVHMRAPRAELKRAKREPVIGALLYAIKQAGWSVTPEVTEQIEHTGPGSDFYRTR